MSKTTGGASGAAGVKDERMRSLCAASQADAERDAQELLRCCREGDVTRIREAARRASLSAGRLAGFAANVARLT